MASVLTFELGLAATEDRATALRLRDDLRDTLLDHGAVKVDEVDVGHPPPGRRAGVAEWIGLIVAAAGTLAAVLQVLEAWQSRHANSDDADTTITLRVGEVTVTISNVPTPEELSLIRALLERIDGRADDDGN